MTAIFRTDSEGYLRLADRILKDAANSKAADIKIIRTPEKTAVRFIIAGQEIDYGVSITSMEGNAVISCIFDARDDGAGHSSKPQGVFQGFSLSNARNRMGHGPTMPPNVLKLRFGWNSTGPSPVITIKTALPRACLQSSGSNECCG